MRVTGFWMERDGTVDVVGQTVREDDVLNDRDRKGAFSRFTGLKG